MNYTDTLAARLHEEATKQDDGIFNPDRTADLLREAANHVAAFHAAAADLVTSTAKNLEHLEAIHALVRDSRSYVPQDIAAECLLLLQDAGMGQPGRPNTLHAMVSEACAKLRIVHAHRPRRPVAHLAGPGARRAWTSRRNLSRRSTTVTSTSSARRSHSSGCSWCPREHHRLERHRDRTRAYTGATLRTERVYDQSRVHHTRLLRRVVPTPTRPTPTRRADPLARRHEHAALGQGVDADALDTRAEPPGQPGVVSAE